MEAVYFSECVYMVVVADPESTSNYGDDWDDRVS